MAAALLLAKLCLVGVLATFLPLFAGVRRRRRTLASLLVVFVAALAGFTAAAYGLRTSLPGAQSAGAARSSGTAARLIHDPPLLVLTAIGLLAVLALLTWIAWRSPKWMLPAAVVLMALRLPLGFSLDAPKLLWPLYLVILALLIAEVVVRDRLAPPEGAHRDHLRVALAAFIGLAGLSVLWGGFSYASGFVAFTSGLVKLWAFYLPFAAVYYLVFRYVRHADDLRRILMTVLWFGVLLAVIGVTQYATHWILFNRARLLREASLGQGFRVNSLFFDPNVFSRFLIMALLLCAVLALVEPRRRRVLAPVAALFAIAHVFTLSRSGWVSLLAGLIMLGYAWLGARRGTYALAALLLAFGAGLGALIAVRGTPIRAATLRHPWGINKITGGRYYLVTGGLLMFRAHPEGVGLGIFPHAYPFFRDFHARKTLVENHTTPVAVLSELGAQGLAAYLLILAAFFSTAFGRLPRRGHLHPPLDGHGPPDRYVKLAAAGLASVVLAIVAHSLLYDAFFEDPYTWLMMALAAATACRLTTWRGAEPVAVTVTTGAPATAPEPRSTPRDESAGRATLQQTRPDADILSPLRFRDKGPQERAAAID